MTSGRVWRDTTVFWEIRPGVGFETGDFVKDKLVVLTPMRLMSS